MGTGATSPMRKFRSTGQMSTSGVSSLWRPIQVRKTSETVKWMNECMTDYIIPVFLEYGLCSVSLNNMLYLVGGQTTVADCYNVERDEWKPISVMKERRMECGAAVIDGCVYVSGGYSYSKGTYLQSIEKYDPQLDSWEIVGTLPSPTRSHGCVCVFAV